MQPSMFNVKVPLAAADGAADTFLMNTFTDAQIVVGPEVTSLLDRLGDGAGPGVLAALTSDERDAIATLTEHGFLVDDRASERQRLETFFRGVRDGQEQLRVTVLTTLQCNFACDYCIQGDHGDYNKTAAKMSLANAERVAAWVDERMDALAPSSFVLTFFGGEPLLNLPVMYYLAERLWQSSQTRGVSMQINVITNGLLLTPEVVDRLEPFGLNGFKITLDGDRATHDRMRPLRGGQGTFEKIVANIRRVAGRCSISLGGNFDEILGRVLSGAPRLSGGTGLRAAHRPGGVQAGDPRRHAGGHGRPREPFDRPQVHRPHPGLGRQAAQRHVHDVGRHGTSGGACDSCHFLDDKMSELRDETKRRGFKTSDGVHMGPCEIHRKHAYTIGPDGDLYACPGFTGDTKMSTGHIDGRQDGIRANAATRFDQLAAWKECRDCAFIPVCAGGCTVASHAELGDMHAPNCHKKSFEAGVVSLARDAAAALVYEQAN